MGDVGCHSVCLGKCRIVYIKQSHSDVSIGVEIEVWEGGWGS